MDLSSVRKDILEEALLLRKSVERVVRLALGANVAADGEGGVLAGNGAALLVNVSNVDLNRGVVLGLDDAVGGIALARNVKLDLKDKS